MEIAYTRRNAKCSTNRKLANDLPGAALAGIGKRSRQKTPSSRMKSESLQMQLTDSIRELRSWLKASGESFGIISKRFKKKLVCLRCSMENRIREKVSRGGEQP